jgi:putative salt-induced outer membrane protein YdiY
MSIYIVCVVLLFASQEVAAADEIVLSDGTRLAGTLLSWTREGIVFRATDGAVRTLVPREIVRLSMGSKSIEAVTARLSAPDERTRPADVPPATSTSHREVWRGAFDVSYAGHRGTADSDSLVLDLRAERHREPWRLRLRSRYFRALKNRALAGNEWLWGGRLDRFFSPRLFIFASGDFEFDEIEKVDLRSVYAVGFGSDLLVSEAHTLSISGGTGYTREDFRDGRRREFLSGVFRQEFRRRLSSRSHWEQQFHFLQDLRDAPRFKLRIESAIRVRVSELLTIRFGISDAYDHRPQPGVQRNEVTFTTGLGLVF